MKGKVIESQAIPFVRQIFFKNLLAELQVLFPSDLHTENPTWHGYVKGCMVIKFSVREWILYL